MLRWTGERERGSGRRRSGRKVRRQYIMPGCEGVEWGAVGWEVMLVWGGWMERRVLLGQRGGGEEVGRKIVVDVSSRQVWRSRTGRPLVVSADRRGFRKPQ